MTSLSDTRTVFTNTDGDCGRERRMWSTGNAGSSRKRSKREVELEAERENLLMCDASCIIYTTFHSSYQKLFNLAGFDRCF